MNSSIFSFDCNFREIDFKNFCKNFYSLVKTSRSGVKIQNFCKKPFNKTGQNCTFLILGGVTHILFSKCGNFENILT
eukprot:Pgem_evm1s10280